MFVSRGHRAVGPESRSSCPPSTGAVSRSHGAPARPLPEHTYPRSPEAGIFPNISVKLIVYIFSLTTPEILTEHIRTFTLLWCRLMIMWRAGQRFKLLLFIMWLTKLCWTWNRPLTLWLSCLKCTMISYFFFFVNTILPVKKNQIGSVVTALGYRIYLMFVGINSN